MRLKVCGGLDEVGRADHPANTPTGHGIGLGNAVEDHAGIGKARDLSEDRGEHVVAERQVFINLVGNDPNAVLECPLTNRTNFFRRVHRASRVRRRNEDKRFGLVSACSFELFNRDAKARLDIGRKNNRNATGQSDGLGIGRPVGRRKKNFVARVQQRFERVVNRVLPAVGYKYLTRRHLDL